MTIYTFDPHLYCQKILLVGCGGTGSQLARAIARMVYQMKHAGQSTPQVAFIDPDVVEHKNVGRQLFTYAEADAGIHKAEALARRFNFSLGLNIAYYNEAFSVEKHIERGGNTIVLGAVDNHLARQELSRLKDSIEIDCGNHHNSGQVIIGNTASMDKVQEHFEYAQKHDCKTVSYLPYATTVYPSLLEPEPEPDTTLSCAELTQQGEQSVLINGFIASIAAEYLRKLLHREPITTHCTTFTGDVLSMRSMPIQLGDWKASIDL